ncbi:hypothetical protein BJ912DRAFT_65991 [Pholiota molesta]|nr:hypothetical protein BJ912DRAFT_65991 [Pholiota molesta]
MIYPSMQTLKHLRVKTVFSQSQRNRSTDPFCGLCIELVKMENNNLIEMITIEVCVNTNVDFMRGDDWGLLDSALTESGWPKLQGVLLKIIFWSYERSDDRLDPELRRWRQTQFPKLTSSKSLSFELTLSKSRLSNS